MLVFLAVLLIIALLLLFLLCRKFKVTIRYRSGIFTVQLERLVLYSSGRMKKEKEKGYYKIPKTSFNDIRLKYTAGKDLYISEKSEIAAILHELSRSFDIKKLDIAVTFGFGDAAVTGIANGFIWLGITGIITILKRYIKIDDITNIAVYPHYTEACFDVDVCLVFETRIIQIFGVYKRIKSLINRNKSKLKELVV